ncbi:MAG: hypothetical protein WC769_05165 [Thermodesulfovibrionales bacterium]|jgi:hypothetical protein
MSFWWYRKDNSGKKILWQIDIEPLLIIILFGMFVAFVWPRFFLNLSFVLMLPFLLAMAGFVCLLAAKISLYRKGLWFSFGYARMSKGYATLYKVAYVLLGLGVLLILQLLRAL